jgi:hypothetical protein
MLLKFKNEHIYYALEPLWSDINLNYKFKTHVNDLVIAKPDNDAIQEIEISKDILVQIYKAVSMQPEGPTSAINKEIKEILLPQLLAESNNDIDNPNEAFSTILAIQELDFSDIAARAALIEKGKNKILK